ncbi:MAG: HEAT repeat domain-containing protein [Dokdonella sp.]
MHTPQRTRFNRISLNRTGLNQVILRAALAAVLSVGIAGASLTAHAASNDAMAPTDKQLNQLYWQGQEALSKSDWTNALKRFTDLEQQLREREPKSADAAIYWQAYALLQAKRGTEAKALIDRLHHDYPDSRWGRDADALLRQSQPASVRSAASSDDDEEIAEVAVEGLMNAPPERALPLLKKVLQSQHSDKVKKRALFVLSQLDSDAAYGIVVDIAKTGSNPELRDEAIRMLGISGEPRAIERLREIYAGSKDAKEKRAIMQAWLIADRKDLILAAARNEADADVRQQAIQALGVLDGSSELKQLFDSTQDAASQRSIVQAFGVAGNVKELSAIAEGKYADEIRMAAVQSLGIAGNEGGSAVLVRMYPTATTQAMRDVILQGLLIAGDSDAMLKLYRQAKSADEKRALLRMITIAGGNNALDVIESELKN